MIGVISFSMYRNFPEQLDSPFYWIVPRLLCVCRASVELGRRFQDTASAELSKYIYFSCIYIVWRTRILRHVTKISRHKVHGG
jgi:hypothetical protein